LLQSITACKKTLLASFYTWRQLVAAFLAMKNVALVHGYGKAGSVDTIDLPIQQDLHLQEENMVKSSEQQ